MTNPIMGWTVIAVAGGSALIGIGRRMMERRRVRRELRERPALASDTNEGTVVTVEGTVRALEPVTAPLSGRPCAVYRSMVDATNWIVRGASRKGLSEMTVVTPFLVDRGAEGTVLVEGTFAVLDVPMENLKKIDRQRREHFLVANGVPAKQRHRAGLVEWVVADGDRVRVAGLVMHDPASEPDAGSAERDFRDAPPPTLRITGNVDHPLAIGRAK